MKVTLELKNKQGITGFGLDKPNPWAFDTAQFGSILKRLKVQQTAQNIDETVWVVKLMNPKVATSLNKLRTACIELLCTTMAWANFKTPNYSDLRAKIITMFFKPLTYRTSKIVAVAKEGLRQFINQQKMPKELLQSSLRPACKWNHPQLH